MGTWRRLGGGLLIAAAAAVAQQAWDAGLSSPDPGQRVKAVRTLADAPHGFRHIDSLAPLLQDESEDVRTAVVAALISLRTIDGQPLLIEATKDLSPRVQSLAVDGLVDFYLPEYVKLGRLASIKAFAATLKGRFSKPSPLTLPEYVSVNEDVIDGIAQVVRTGRSEEARANAARAVGILRGRSALDALLGGVRSRNSTIILESVLAIKKLREASAGPDLVFLLGDLDPKVQKAVIQTVGQLQTKEAVPGLVRIVRESGRTEHRVEALIALAKIPDNGQRAMFLPLLADRERGVRAAAAEGLGRIGNPEDLRRIGDLLAQEKSETVRLSLAFAAVSMGNLARLDILVKGLNSSVHRMEARPFLVEAARNPEVLRRLYAPLADGSDAQRRHLAYVLSQSGDAESVGYLQTLARDNSDQVAAAAIEALRILQARLR